MCLLRCSSVSTCCKKCGDICCSGQGRGGGRPDGSGQGRGRDQPGCSRQQCGGARPLWAGARRRPARLLRAPAPGRNAPSRGAWRPALLLHGGGRPWCFGQGRMAAGPAARKCAVLLCIDKL